MLYKLFPLQTDARRRGLVVGQTPPPVPKHTPASLAASVRESFPDMTVYEPKGKPFIVVQADLPLPPKLGPNTNERRRRMGEHAIEAICRNMNCRSQPVAKRREQTVEDQIQLLRKWGFDSMARALEKKQAH